MVVGKAWVQSQVKFFFCSNASIAFARSLCKYLLAVLITAREADTVASFLDSWCHAVWCHSTEKTRKNKKQDYTQQKQTKPQKEPAKRNKPQGNHKNKNRWNESIMNYWWKALWPGSLCASYRAGHPLKQQKDKTKNITGWADRCQAKKVAMPKPGIPPARIPEIAMRGRAGMTSTNAHRPRRYAGRVRKTKVKRQWDIQSEKVTTAFFLLQRLDSSR